MQSVKYLFVSCNNCNNCSNYTISVFYSNTGINNLRSDSHYHINKNSRSKEGDAADNSEYMMQQDVAAENMATHYHESTYWHDLENQDQQR